jgi:hypothetical protein
MPSLYLDVAPDQSTDGMSVDGHDGTPDLIRDVFGHMRSSSFCSADMSMDSEAPDDATDDVDAAASPATTGDLIKDVFGYMRGNTGFSWEEIQEETEPPLVLEVGKINYYALGFDASSPPSAPISPIVRSIEFDESSQTSQSGQRRERTVSWDEYQFSKVHMAVEDAVRSGDANRLRECTKAAEAWGFEVRPC